MSLVGGMLLIVRKVDVDNSLAKVEDQSCATKPGILRAGQQARQLLGLLSAMAWTRHHNTTADVLTFQKP